MAERIAPSSVTKAAGKSGHTKKELADKLQVSYLALSNLVNSLVAEGKLVVLAPVPTGKRGRPAPRFAVPESE